MIHRDIKPANILISKNLYKIADFGLAKVLNINEPLSKLQGTPFYFPPEAFSKGYEYDESFDIWSFGKFKVLILRCNAVISDVPLLAANISLCGSKGFILHGRISKNKSLYKSAKLFK